MKSFRTSIIVAILTALVALAVPAIAQQSLTLNVLETKQIPAGVKGEAIFTLATFGLLTLISHYRSIAALLAIQMRDRFGKHRIVLVRAPGYFVSRR